MSATAIISWKNPGFRDGVGPCNAGIDMPRMRPRKRFNLRSEIVRLDISIRAMTETPCCFWACEGPNRPRNMITCSRCWALRDIVGVRNTLAASIGLPPITDDEVAARGEAA